MTEPPSSGDRNSAEAPRSIDPGFQAEACYSYHNTKTRVAKLLPLWHRPWQRVFDEVWDIWVVRLRARGKTSARDRGDGVSMIVRSAMIDRTRVVCDGNTRLFFDLGWLVCFCVEL